MGERQTSGKGASVDDLGKLIRDKLEEALRDRGHANVLIAGRTGVGKSTLVNSIFQGDLATTGQGRPVTKNTREITKEDVPLSIFDTRGLEMADFSSTLEALKSFVSERRSDPDEKKHIHVGWVCIAEDLRRVEEAETELAAMLAEFMPVIAIITKAEADGGFRAEVQRLLPLARNCVRVRSIPKVLDDGHKLPPMGLKEVVQVTMDLFPEGHRSAFVAAQKADLALKRKTSEGIVAASAASAATIGAVPLPFADAALLLPLQIGMLASVSATYGLSLSRAFLATLAATTIGGTAASLAGRSLVGGLLKLVPGVGLVIGGTISAGTAAAITTALGMAYISTLEVLFGRHEGEPPDTEEVLDEVKKRFAKELLPRNP